MKISKGYYKSEKIPVTILKIAELYECDEVRKIQYNFQHIAYKIGYDLYLTSGPFSEAITIRPTFNNKVRWFVSWKYKDWPTCFHAKDLKEVYKILKTNKY